MPNPELVPVIRGIFRSLANLGCSTASGSRSLADQWHLRATVGGLMSHDKAVTIPKREQLGPTLSDVSNRRVDVARGLTSCQKAFEPIRSAPALPLIDLPTVRKDRL